MEHEPGKTFERVAVYCGSSAGHNPEYSRAAESLGQVLSAKNIGLVYGGGKVGLMGAVADAVLNSGGEVIGVLPEFLSDKEVAHEGLPELRIVHDMHARKSAMSQLADGFIALPGGLGTMEEMFEMLTWLQLSLHEKPCGLLNVCGFYDHLITFLDHMTAEGFLKQEYRAMLLCSADPAKLIDRMLAFEVPAVKKWIGLK